MLIHDIVSMRMVPSIPWKNGGGTTRTLATAPVDAGLDDFTWRISMAKIREAGSFSAFPHIDRTILLWSGDGVVLHAPEWGAHALTERLAPFYFRGEDTVRCEMIDGPTEDLNLMVRRGCVRAQLSVAKREVLVDFHVDELIILCVSGQLRLLATNQEEKQLGPEQMLRISALDAPARLIPNDQNTQFVVITMRFV